MKVHTLELGTMGNCCYIVQNGPKAIIIDPSWDMPQIYGLLRELKITPAAVFFTHGHYDHCTNAEELLKKYNIKGYIEAEDLALSGLPQELLNTFKGDFKTEIAGIKAEFIHTPGHTAGSCCIAVESGVFTGDTLFPGGAGRTDFPESRPELMFKSLERLAHLPQQTVLYCGHAYGPQGGSVTTVAYESRTNPFLRHALGLDDI